MNELVIVASGVTLSTRPTAARALYKGNLFAASVAYAEATALPWCVLSLKYGLVDPDVIIDPYDPYPQRKRGRRELLADSVQIQLKDRAPVDRIAVVGGDAHLEVIRWAAPEHHITAPLQELPARATGYYISWLRRRARRLAPANKEKQP